MTAQTMILPYYRSTPLHAPRCDLSLAASESVTLRITVVESDHPSARLLVATGGPTLLMQVSAEALGTRPDYGRDVRAAGTTLWSGVATLSTEVAGSFDVFIPASTMQDWPARCVWAVHLAFADEQSVMLASGILSVRHGFGGPAIVTIDAGTVDPDLAPIATLSISALTFAATDIGETPAAQTVMVTNTGDAPLIITAITPAGDFARSGVTLPATLAPDFSATISVTFTPTLAGARTGSLAIVSNAAGSPATVALTGTGVAVVAPTMLRLSTLGNQIVDSTGATVRLKSINWHGAESDTFCPHGLWARRWSAMLDQIHGLGFNCIRLPFSDAILNPANIPNGIDTSQNADLVGLSALQILDTLIDYGATIGLRFVLDHHRTTAGAGTDGWPNATFTDSYTPANWLTMWQAMATRYASRPAVCGFDVHNEPHNVLWSVWAPHVETLANAVHVIAPDWLVFVEGVGISAASASYWWGGQLADAAARPIALTIPNKVVLSPHEYGLSVGTQTWLNSTTNTVPGWPTSLKPIWQAAWSAGFVSNSVPIWVGEMGGKLGYAGNGTADGNPNTANERAWFSTLVQYLNGDLDLDGGTNLTGSQKGMSFAFWTFGPNSGDTGGLLQDDWTTVQAGKLALIGGLLA